MTDKDIKNVEAALDTIDEALNYVQFGPQRTDTPRLSYRQMEQAMKFVRQSVQSKPAKKPSTPRKKKSK